MKKCVVISDSFKGTLSTFDIMRIFKDAAKDIFPSCELLSFPIADGGEGTMEAFASSLDGEIIQVPSANSNGEKIVASYFVSGHVAYMDVASCLYLASTKIKDPKITTSYGVGLLIKDAIKRGCKKIVMGLGGSSTNDAGCGILSALGVKFFKENGDVFLPTGGNLDEVKRFNTKEMDELIKDIEVVGMCDVSNPLLRENGASMVYAKQKGAKDGELQILDRKMEIFSNVVAAYFSKDYSSVPGAGAAGGIGFAIVSFLHGHLEKGIDVMLRTLHFADKLNDVNVIFTGEGNVDSQTKNGKVVDGIKNVAKKCGIPVVVIAGGADLSSESLIDDTLKAIITTNRKPMDFEKLKPYSEKYYYVTIKNVLRLIKLGEELGK